MFKRFLIIPVLALAALATFSFNHIENEDAEALSSVQVIQFNPGLLHQVGTTAVINARSCETVAPYACGAANQGITHTFVSFTPSVCTASTDALQPWPQVTMGSITFHTTGTCHVRVTASGPGVGTNPAAKWTYRNITVVS